MASKMNTYAQFKQTCTTTLASAISRDGVAREMLRSVTSGRKEASSEGADLTIVPELSLASVTWAVLSSVISSLKLVAVFSNISMDLQKKKVSIMQFRH